MGKWEQEATTESEVQYEVVLSALAMLANQQHTQT